MPWSTSCVPYGLAQAAGFITVKSAVCEPRGITPCEPLGHSSRDAETKFRNGDKSKFTREGLRYAVKASGWFQCKGRSPSQIAVPIRTRASLVETGPYRPSRSSVLYFPAIQVRSIRIVSSVAPREVLDTWADRKTSPKPASRAEVTTR
jgi:hypothetical protein